MIKKLKKFATSLWTIMLKIKLAILDYNIQKKSLDGVLKLLGSLKIYISWLEIQKIKKLWQVLLVYLKSWTFADKMWS